MSSHIVLYGRMTVNDELQRMWKKAAVAYFKPNIFFERHAKPQSICHHS
jgi:hypothetical protein